MRLLVAASEPIEFSGLLRRAKNVRRLKPAAGWARAARLGGNDLLLVANGAGVGRAGLAVDDALSGFAAEAMASTGLCGAVDPALRPSDIVLGTEVVYRERRFPALDPAAGSPLRRGVIRTIDHIAQTAEEKTFWRTTGAVAVEMEAAAVAERAETHHLPFFCVKAVSDLANETLANDLNAALRQDGHFDTIKVLGSSLRHPQARLPELFRLWRRSARAASILGDFFADCRF